MRCVFEQVACGRCPDWAPAGVEQAVKAFDLTGDLYQPDCPVDQERRQYTSQIR